MSPAADPSAIPPSAAPTAPPTAVPTIIAPGEVIREPVFISLPPLHRRVPLRKLLFIVLIMLAAMSITYATLRASWIVVLIFGVVFVSMFVIMMLIIPLRERRQLRKHLAPLPETPSNSGETLDRWRTLLVKTVQARPLIAFTPEREHISWSDLERRRIVDQLPRCLTMASFELQPELDAIPRSAELLEPELILSSHPQSTRTAIFLCIMFLFQAALQFSTRRWWLSGMNVGLALLMLWRIPRVRGLIPALRFENFAPVAGLGVVEDRKTRRWTVADSTMFVWSRKAGQPLFVQIGGPAGWLAFTFSSSADPDFIALWQRWTHSSPRPELL